MSVEVDIYMSGIVKFFNSNPQDLKNLIPVDKKDEFFEKIREVASSNVENGNDPALTQKQILEICVLLNRSQNIEIKSPNNFHDSKVLIPTSFGTICLN